MREVDEFQMMREVEEERAKNANFIDPENEVFAQLKLAKQEIIILVERIQELEAELTGRI